MLLWFLVVSLAASCVHGIERKAKKVSYELIFETSVQNCENFNNKVMDYSGMELKTNSSISWLEGNVQINEEIVSGTIVKVTVYKKEEITGEYVLYYTIDGNLCEHITDEEVPWTALFQGMRITSCPIQAKTYEGVTINLNVDYASEDLLTHENCGFYKCDMEMMAPAATGGPLAADDNIISCHTVTTELVQIMQEAK